jgi:hypothetical protein
LLFDIVKNAAGRNGCQAQRRSYRRPAKENSWTARALCLHTLADSEDIVMATLTLSPALDRTKVDHTADDSSSWLGRPEVGTHTLPTVRIILSDHCSSLQADIVSHLVAALVVVDDAHRRWRLQPRPTPQFTCSRLPPGKFCEKLKDTYPSPCACKFAGKIESVDQSLALSSNGFFARLNNLVIQRNKYVPPEVYAQ